MYHNRKTLLLHFSAFVVVAVKRSKRLEVKPLLMVCVPVVCLQEELVILRPRLCHMRKGSNGYGFNLHSDKNKAGQFIRAVDEDSPAQRAGLRPKDKIIQVCFAAAAPECSPCAGPHPVTSAGDGHPESVSGYQRETGERQCVRKL